MMSFILIAFRNVLLAKRRTILLGISLALVAMLFILLSSLTRGVNEQMLKSATTLSSGHINVGGFFKLRARGAAPMVNERQRILDLVHKTLPDAHIIDRYRGWGRIIGQDSSINAGISGINVETEKDFFASIILAPEKDYKKDGADTVRGNLQGLMKKNSVLIFSSQAKKLGVNVGDSLTIVSEATGGQTNSVDVTIAAIAKDIGFMSNYNIFVPRQTLLDLYRAKEDSTGVVMIYLKDITQAEAKMSVLKEALLREKFAIMEHDPNPFYMKFDKVMGEDWLGQKLDLTLWKDEISFILWVSTALNFITFTIISILSFIIASGIANAMWMSVRERIKEIGTIRAIGAFRKQILAIFLLEALFLGLIFVGGSAILSTGLIFLLNSLHIPVSVEGARIFLMTDTLHFSISFPHIIMTVFLFCLIAMAGAFFPAWRASRLNPADALRQGN